MQIPRSIIHDAVKLCSGTSHFDESCAAGYSDVEFLPETAAEMRADTLYVCGLSAALKRAEERPGCSYACIRDCFWTEAEDDLLPGSGAIIINENRSVTWLFSILHARVREVHDWVYQMQTTLLSGGSYQDLLDLSEPILGNPVYILDPSYALMAYTKNVPIREPINVALVKNGYHNDETIRRLQENHRFSLYDNADHPVVIPASHICSSECICMWCKHRGVFLTYTIMVCEHIPLSNALVDLFSILMDYIRICFEKQQARLPNPQERHTSFFLDILYEGEDDRQRINERANQLGIPQTGHFDLFRITFTDNSIILIGRVLKELRALLPNAWIVAHDYEITILNSYDSDDSDRAYGSETAALLEELLEQYGAVCGISSGFSNLHDIKNAASQASNASAIGQSIYLLGNFWNFDEGVWAALSKHRAKKLFYYDRVSTYHVMYLAQKQMPGICLNTYNNRAIAELMRIDRDRGSKMTQILFVYLTADSSATGASKLLNMHRNNIVYHISKIEELLGLDLRDLRVRQNLSLAFLSTELKAAMDAGLLS